LVYCSTLAVFGQTENIATSVNSPYSRFGLGDFDNPYLAAQAGMGGLTAAYHNPFHLNPMNPASLAQLKATAFEVALDGTYSLYSTPSIEESAWGGNLSYLALGFPLINPLNKVLDRRQSPWGLGMAFILQPFTTVGYNVEAKQNIESVGGTTNLLKGDGGIYRFSWNNGVKYGPMSGGLTLGFNRGSITNSREVLFDSLQLAYATTFLDEVTVSGFYWRFGLQYTHDFTQPDAKSGEQKPSGKKIIFGLHGSTQNTFSTRSNRFAQRSLPNVQDTLFNENDVEGDGLLPSSFTAGITYQQQNKLRLGVEAGFSQWSQYENDAQSNVNLQDSWQLRFGGEIIPNYQSYNNYFERVRYRFGAYYRTDPRQFEGEQLLDYGLSLGLGFPIVLPRQRTSFVNFAVEAGRFGLSDELQETYVRMTLGFTLNDNTWFFKRKFN